MSELSSPFIKLNHRRRSVRHYRPDPVPRISIERCLEASRLAPSANNGQPWDFVVVADNRIREKLVHAARFGPLRANHFANQAPVIVALNESPGHRPTRWGGRLVRRNFIQMDIGIAVENFCLQAAEEGLGSCIIGLFIASEVRRALKLPRSLKPMLLITLGWPADDAPSSAPPIDAPSPGSAEVPADAPIADSPASDAIKGRPAASTKSATTSPTKKRKTLDDIRRYVDGEGISDAS